MSTSPTDVNRPAPADEPAERALLGAAMLRPEAADILTTLGADPLWSTNHKHIAQAIISLHADHQPVDFGQVASRMPPKLLEQVGGINELIAIQTTVPSSGNAAGYAERIRQAAQRRMLVGLAGDLRDRAYDGRDVEGVLAELGDLHAGDISTDARDFDRVKLDLSKLPEAPATIGQILYEGRLTVLQSEPEGGKSWVATELCRLQVEAGHDVMYLDEEGGADIVTERLIALGADPEAVDAHFHYFPFEARKWNLFDLQSLHERIVSLPGLVLGVFDSLPDFLAAAGLSEDSSTDLTRFVNQVLAQFRRENVAQLLLDHLTKPPVDQGGGKGKNKRSRYSRGTGAKLAKADVTILLEVAQPFDVRTSGLLHLWRTKDRRGRLELPRLGQDPLALAVTVDNGSVTIAEAEVVKATPDSVYDGPTDCMAAVAGLLQHEATEYTGNQLADQMRVHGYTFRNQTIRVAAEKLAIEHPNVAVRVGARKSRLYRWTDTKPVPLDDEAF